MPGFAPPPVVWDPELQAYLTHAFGEEGFQQLAAALQRPPVAPCLRVNTLKASPEAVLQAVCATPAFAAGGGVCRAALHPRVPIAVIVQGSGPHNDLDYSVCDGKEVVISRKAGEAVLRGADVFVPGVLACSPHMSKGDRVLVSLALEPPGSSHCGIQRGTTLGSEAAASQPGLAGDRSGLCLGIGVAEMGRTEMFRQEKGVAIVMEQRVFEVPPITSQLPFGSGQLQHLPSVVAALALAPTPGSQVLDMCAAPGGKTTVLAQLMENQGGLFALDRSYAKVEEILSLAREMGATCVHALKMDATRAVLPPSASNGINATSSGAPITASDGGPAEAAMEQREAAMEQRQAGGRVAEAAAAPPSDPQPAAAAPPAKASSASTSGAAEPVPAGAAPIPAAAASTAAVPGPGLSLKLQQRTQRRLNSMAARGITPPPSELRKAGLLAGPTCAGFEAESFDFILLDAPCTATGLRPRLVQPLTLAAVRQTEHYQRQLLGAAVRLLKQGGFLVYSTCSINPGENEANVRYVLDHYPFMRLVAHEPRVGGRGLTRPAGGSAAGSSAAGRSTACGSAPEPASTPAGPSGGADAAAAVLTTGGTAGPSSNFSASAAGSRKATAASGRSGSSSAGDDDDGAVVWLSEEEAQLVQRFDPMRMECIGFFIARFHKVASCIM